MEILVIIIAVTVITVLVLHNRRQPVARAKAAADHTPSLTALAEELGGRLIGPGEASAWSPALQRAQHKPVLTIEFQRGPWHVRVTEAAYKPLDHNMSFEHWIEIATVPVTRRRAPLEFFTLFFENGFARVECSDRIRPDELVFLVDMILETLELMPGVEPRDPAAV